MGSKQSLPASVSRRDGSCMPKRGSQTSSSTHREVNKGSSTASHATISTTATNPLNVQRSSRDSNLSSAGSKSRTLNVNSPRTRSGQCKTVSKSDFVKYAKWIAKDELRKMARNSLNVKESSKPNQNSITAAQVAMTPKAGPKDQAPLPGKTGLLPQVQSVHNSPSMPVRGFNADAATVRNTRGEVNANPPAMSLRGGHRGERMGAAINGDSVQRTHNTGVSGTSTPASGAAQHTRKTSLPSATGNAPGGVLANMNLARPHNRPLTTVYAVDAANLDKQTSCHSRASNTGGSGNVDNDDAHITAGRDVKLPSHAGKKKMDDHTKNELARHRQKSLSSTQTTGIDRTNGVSIKFTSDVSFTASKLKRVNDLDLSKWESTVRRLSQELSKISLDHSLHGSSKSLKNIRSKKNKAVMRVSAKSATAMADRKALHVESGESHSAHNNGNSTNPKMYIPKQPKNDTHKDNGVECGENSSTYSNTMDDFYNDNGVTYTKSTNRLDFEAHNDQRGDRANREKRSHLTADVNGKLNAKSSIAEQETPSTACNLDGMDDNKSNNTQRMNLLGMTALTKENSSVASNSFLSSPYTNYDAYLISADGVANQKITTNMSVQSAAKHPSPPGLPIKQTIGGATDMRAVIAQKALHLAKQNAALEAAVKNKQPLTPQQEHQYNQYRLKQKEYMMQMQNTHGPVPDHSLEEGGKSKQDRSNKVYGASGQQARSQAGISPQRDHAINPAMAGMAPNNAEAIAVQEAYCKAHGYKGKIPQPQPFLEGPRLRYKPRIDYAKVFNYSMDQEPVVDSPLKAPNKPKGFFATMFSS